MAAGYTQVYECPHGCKAQGGKPIAATIRGWKKHMTRNHGGYDDAQLAAIVGAAAPNPETGRARFLSEVDTVDTPGLFAEADGETTRAESPMEGNAVDAARSTPEPAKKRVKFKPKAMREFLSGLPEMFFKSKGIETDEADKNLLDAASQMLEELFGIEFEVPDTNWVIKSRLLALLFPFAAVLVIYAKHTISPDWFKKEPEPEQPEQQSQAAD